MTGDPVPTHLTYLDRAMVRQLLPGLPEQLDHLARTYQELADGRIENPAKIGVHPRPESFLHAMPAYLVEADVTAIKWVGAYPANPSHGRAYISGLIVLNDSETGLPLAVMDAAEITAARTAAASAVSIRHLAHAGWRRVAILGYGEQGRQHAQVVAALNPGAEIRVFAGPRPVEPHSGVELYPDARAAVEGADVVITAGPMSPDPKRRLDRAWLPDRCLVVPVDFSAYVDARLVEQAAVLVVDDISQFEHYRALGHFAGWPAPAMSLGAALAGTPAGDLRVSCSLGVGAVDAVMAHLVWQRARARGVGVHLPR